MTIEKLETLVQKHGEKYRRLIEDALAFLDKRETEWGLSDPINRDEFIKDLVKRASGET